MKKRAYCFYLLLFLALQHIYPIIPSAFATCYDARGEIVIEIPDNSINDVAMAKLEGDNAAVIRYNTRVLSTLAPQTRRWFYAHECAHHMRGHMFGPGGNLTFRRIAEQEADCAGTEYLWRTGELSMADISVIQRDIDNLGPGDWIYLSGRQRAINVARCMSDDSPNANFEIFIKPLPAVGPVDALLPIAHVTVYIDGVKVGAISNGSGADRSISVSDFIEGERSYYLHTVARRGVPPFDSHIIKKIGKMRFKDGYRYRVTGDINSGEVRLIQD